MQPLTTFLGSGFPLAPSVPLGRQYPCTSATNFVPSIINRTCDRVLGGSSGKRQGPSWITKSWYSPRCTPSQTPAWLKSRRMVHSPTYLRFGGSLGRLIDMDATQRLVAATRRYLDGQITLVELYDLECELIHQLAQLPAGSLGLVLTGTIELELAHMHAAFSTESDLREALLADLLAELKHVQDAESVSIVNSIAIQPAPFTQVFLLIRDMLAETFVADESVASTHQYAHGN